MKSITTSSIPVRASRGTFAGLLMFAAFAIGCSSEAVTAPTRQERQALAVSFDAMRNASHDPGRVGALKDMLQFLALGAPVDTIPISKNGTEASYPALAANVVQAVGGRPFDSLFIALAWHGDPIDTIFVFEIEQVGAPVGEFVISPSDTSFGTSPGTVTEQYAASAPGGTCANLLTQTPADVFVPPELQCQRQTVSVSMSAPLQFTNAPTVTIGLPQQSVKGVRLVFNAP